MAKHRSFTVMLTEAELLVSSADFVADFLQKTKRQKWASDNEIDDETEKSLLARQDDRIDLALARYAMSDDVLSELYGRGQQILRAAVLSNERHPLHEGSFAWKFLRGADDKLSWLGRLSDLELEAFFSNKYIHDELVTSFFEKSEVWSALNDDQRLLASWYMIKKLVDRPTKNNSYDWDDIGYSSVFDAAWTFSKVSDVSYEWAARLETLYARLVPECFSDFDPLETAKRWHAVKPGDGKAAGSDIDNRYGYLTGFAGVRFGLGRLAANLFYRQEFDRAKILDNADIAIRCAGYQELELSTQEIGSACDKDGVFACRHLIYNEKIWRKLENREILGDACSRVSKGYDYIESLVREHNIQSDKIEQKYPSWFEEKIEIEDYRFERKNISEVSVGQIHSYVAKSTELSEFNKQKLSIMENIRTIKLLVLFLVGVAAVEMLFR